MNVIIMIMRRGVPALRGGRGWQAASQGLRGASGAAGPRPDSRKQTYGTVYYNIDYAILYHTIPYYTILYYNILYYTILYYTILYYTVLSTVYYLLHTYILYSESEISKLL